MKSHSFAYAAALAALLAAAPLASASDDKPAAPGKTVTGCVTTANDGKSFTLTESSQDMQSTPKTWTLVATSGVDLSKYANHKVEITGSSDTKSDTTAPTASSGAAAGTKFNVKSVKDISNTCS